MKTDINKLYELLEDGMNIPIPEISKIQRVRKYKPDSRGKQRQIIVVFKDNLARDNVLRNA